MALDANQLATSMVTAATAAAASDWGKIQDVATHEIRVFASRLVEIEQALAAKTVTEQVAIQLAAMARNHIIATVAMLSTMLIMVAQHAIDAAVHAIANAVNTAVGFQLLT